MHSKNKGKVERDMLYTLLWKFILHIFTYKYEDLITILEFCRKLMMPLNKCQASLFFLIMVSNILKNTQSSRPEEEKQLKRSFSAQQTDSSPLIY